MGDTKEYAELIRLENAIKQITSKYTQLQLATTKELRVVRLELSKLMTSWLYELLKYIDVDNLYSVALSRNITLRADKQLGFVKFYSYAEIWKIAYEMFTDDTIQLLKDMLTSRQQTIEEYNEYWNKLSILKSLLLVENL